MKKRSIQKAFVVILCFLVLFSIGGWFLYQKSHSVKAATVTLLTSLFTATQQDVTGINDVLSTHDQDALDAYFNSRYGSHLTEAGYASCYANRIFTAAANVVEKEGSSLQVQSVDLSEIYRTKTEAHFNFVVSVQIVDSPIVYKFSGFVKMLQINTDWKVDSLLLKQTSTN